MWRVSRAGKRGLNSTVESEKDDAPKSSNSNKLDMQGEHVKIIRKKNQKWLSLKSRTERKGRRGWRKGEHVQVKTRIGSLVEYSVHSRCSESDRQGDDDDGFDALSV